MKLVPIFLNNISTDKLISGDLQMLIWNEKYCTGVKKVDEQHQLLFNYINLLGQEVGEGKAAKTLENTLKFLETYASEHFSFEEECMEKYKCPEAQKNKDAHNKFVETLQIYKDRIEKEEDKAAVFHSLHQIAEQWIENHICGVDIHLKKSVNDSHQNPDENS